MINFGFDRYCLWQLNRRPSRYPNPGFEIDGKRVGYKNGEFGPDIVTNYICEFIEERLQCSFFFTIRNLKPDQNAAKSPPCAR